MRDRAWNRKRNDRARRESYRNYLRDYYIHLLINEQLNDRLDDVEGSLAELSSLQEFEKKDNKVVPFPLH